MKTQIPKTIAVLALLVMFTLNLQLSTCCAQGTVFTYQGRVTDNGTNFTGLGQFKFALVTSTNLSHPATAIANMGGTSPKEFVNGYTIISGGSGYVTAPAVTVSAPGGSGTRATATATITGSSVTAINIISPGSGYSGAPTVTIAPPPSNISYTTYWSNDGTSVAGSEPTSAVNVPVSGGLFTVVLGDTKLANMTAIDASLFQQPDLQLRIWFNDGVNGFAALNPVQNLTPAPYADMANSSSDVLGTVSAGQLNGTIPTSNLPNGLGGGGNFASGTDATVSGGGGNTASGQGSTVSGGEGNVATGDAYGTYHGQAAVSGGYYNTASGAAAAIGGGQGNLASGPLSTIPGGLDNFAGGAYTFAAGQQAQARNDGAFVWADSQNAPFISTNNDSFNVRARGGARFLTSGKGMTVDGQPVLAGTVPPSSLSGTYGNAVTFNNAGNSFSGNGSGLSSLNAANISSGTLNDARLSANVAKLNANQTFMGRNSFNQGLGIGTTSTVEGDLTINTNTYLDDHAIYLRGSSGSDHNHGLGYNGQTVTNFGGGQYQVDGPALWGFGGGVLGTRSGGDHGTLVWNPSGVTVNGNLGVTGNINGHNTPAVNWSQAQNESITINSTVTTLANESSLKSAPGYFVITAFAEGNFNGNTVWLELYDTSTAPAAFLTAAAGHPGSGNMGPYGSVSLSWVVPITTVGGYENFALQAYTDSGTSSIYTHNLTVMYFPKRNN